MGHFKEKKKRKSKGWEGIQQKSGRESWVVTVLVGGMRRRGAEQMKSEEEEEKKRELLKKSHLKLQVDTQTQFVLPAVPKVTKRGLPGANSCLAGREEGGGVCTGPQH